MHISRRDALKSAGLALAGTAFPSIIRSEKRYPLSNMDTLKIGLIGCGGRGAGAVKQALTADSNTVLHAVADIFEDKLTLSLDSLYKVFGDRASIPREHRFVGFDAFRSVLDSGVDVVILTTPPHFRPQHLDAAVKAGKHVFCEKPVAVDAYGVRRVLEAAQIAKQKNLSLMSGFCWRFHVPKRESFSRILDGTIGEVTTVYNTFNTGLLWSKLRETGWTDAEYVLRNWLYYSWLSGDHIVEQAIHSIDMMSWAMGDKLPVSVSGTGGRQVRTDPAFGHIYDHFAITYEYGNGAKGFHFSRQQANCDTSYLVETLGTKGRALVNCSQNIHELWGKKNWKYTGKGNDMYQTEHDELFAAIRSGKSVNDGVCMAHSTLLGVMGRMAAYTGKTITWDEAFNSTERLGPPTEDYNFHMKLPESEIARPGFTPFI